MRGMVISHAGRAWNDHGVAMRLSRLKAKIGQSMSWPRGYWSIIWAHATVGGPLAVSVGSLADNVGRRSHLLFDNVGPFRRCLWAHAFLLVGRYR
jgi:hypothetical protein